MNLRPALAILVAFAAINACGKASQPRAKHLLLITVDTLRRDRLGCYGGPNLPSPTIDRLAAEGTLFEDAYTSRGMTLPSMTSYFTSLYPQQHGVIDNKKQIPDADWLFAERLAGAGFNTRCLNASGVLQPGRNNIEQGFLRYDKVLDEQLLTTKAVNHLKHEFGSGGRRDFLWVHYMSPHKPYLPPAPYRTRYTDPDYRGPIAAADDVFDRIYVDKLALGEADIRQAQAIYDGTVAFIDDCVKQLLAALAEAGRERDTLVVFATDHGEDLYSHNRYFYHANSIYRSTTSLALIFRQPGQVAAQRVTGLVENVDFMPTALDWLGLSGAAPPAGQRGDMSGTSLASVLLGTDVVKRDHVIASVGDNIYTARTRDWHYVTNPDQEMPRFPPVEGTYPIAAEELYFVGDDPDEQRNRIGDNPQAVTALRAAIELFKARYVKGGAALPDSLTVEKIDEMIQLGYMGAAEGAAAKEQLRRAAREKSAGGAPGQPAPDQDQDDR